MAAASNHREPGKEHIPNYPKGFSFVRMLQLILAIGAIGINAYILSIATGGPMYFMIFVSIITIIINIWILIAVFKAPKAYNYWAILAFDIILLILWLAAAAVMGLASAAFFATDYLYNDGYFNTRSVLEKRRGRHGSSHSNNSFNSDTSTDDAIDTINRLKAVMAAATAIGVIIFILYFVALIVHSVSVCRHRKAGLHNRPGPAANVSFAMTNNPQYAALAPQQGGPAAVADFTKQDTTYTSTQSVYSNTTAAVPPQNAGYYTNTPPPQANSTYMAPPPVADAKPTSPLQHTNAYQAPTSPAAQTPYNAPPYQEAPASPIPQGGYQAPSYQQPQQHQHFQPAPYQQPQQPYSPQQQNAYAQQAYPQQSYPTGGFSG